MYCNSRLCLAALLSVAFLLLAELLGRYLPNWLSVLAVPTSLSGGEFIVAGLMLGFLLATCAVVCLTALFYLAFWLYAEMTRNADAA
jgi:hypothetical protein